MHICYHTQICKLICPHSHVCTHTCLDTLHIPMNAYSRARTRVCMLTSAHTSTHSDSQTVEVTEHSGGSLLPIIHPSLPSVFTRAAGPDHTQRWRECCFSCRLELLACPSTHMQLWTKTSATGASKMEVKPMTDYKESSPLSPPTLWCSVHMLRQQSQGVPRANIPDKFLEYCQTLGDTVRSKFQNIRGFDSDQRTDMLVHLRVLDPKSKFLKLTHCQSTWYDASLPSVESRHKHCSKERLLSLLGRWWSPKRLQSFLKLHSAGEPASLH